MASRSESVEGSVWARVRTALRETPVPHPCNTQVRRESHPTPCASDVIILPSTILLLVALVFLCCAYWGHLQSMLQKARTELRGCWDARRDPVLLPQGPDLPRRGPGRDWKDSPAREMWKLHGQILTKVGRLERRMRALESAILHRGTEPAGPRRARSCSPGSLPLSAHSTSSGDWETA